MGSADRSINVWHQILSITDIDFNNECIYGFTELTLILQRDEITHINLNCKQCKIYSVVFNGLHEAKFEYCNPLALRCDENRRDLQSFLSHEDLASIAVDADEGNGELMITIPEALRHEISSFAALVPNF